MEKTKIYKDGDKFSILIGENLQEGVAGFGDTLEEARTDLITNLEKLIQEFLDDDNFDGAENYGKDLEFYKNIIFEL